ncbi:hypothetical protein [Yeosuana marina]|uniref:hypothetical protein n=1 Tax=Yeosuana marina TaxID=1565536 RepID=UPI0030EF11D5|tara:strand:- start:58 stop:522 length:465 start_codon:yes stop_codon:yes gene_type:complete
MKKTNLGLILILLTFFISCNEKKISELNNRISELETQNKKLADSISKSDYYKVLGSNIIGLTSKPQFTVNEKSEVKFLFNYPEKLLTYNVYTTTSDGKPDKLIYENLTDNEFMYNFVPKKVGEHNIKLVAVFKMNNKENEEIQVPTNFYVTVKK